MPCLYLRTTSDLWFRYAESILQNRNSWQFETRWPTLATTQLPRNANYLFALLRDSTTWRWQESSLFTESNRTSILLSGRSPADQQWTILRYVCRDRQRWQKENLEVPAPHNFQRSFLRLQIPNNQNRLPGVGPQSFTQNQLLTPNSRKPITNIIWHNWKPQIKKVIATTQSEALQGLTDSTRVHKKASTVIQRLWEEIGQL